MKLWMKLVIGFAVIIGLVILSSAADYQSTQAVNAAFEDIVAEEVALLNQIEQMRSAAGIMEGEGNSIAFLALTGADEEGEGEAEEFEEGWEAFEQALAAFQSIARDEEDVSFVEDLNTAAQSFYQAGQALVALAVMDARIPELMEAWESFETTSDTLRDLLAEAYKSEQAALVAESATASQNATEALTFKSVIAVVMVVSMGTVGILFYRMVTSPLSELQSAAARIAGGDYSQRAPVNSRDEIGELAQTFNTMAAAVQNRDESLSTLNRELEQRALEAQAARERAEQADRAKSAFLASVSHELRTPLNAVINFSKFVYKGVMGPINERQQEALTKVIDSAQHLLALINDVLDMSKIEAGSLNLFIEDGIDLNEIIENAAETGRTMLANKPVTLELDIPDALPKITADRQRIRQIMLNIVSNACKFTQNGSIKISAREKDGDILISVQDTGPGIEEEDHSMVFESFKQTRTGLNHGSGTGLGMPISKSLAEAHGGSLWFESVVGEGTTFFVLLPVASEQALALKVAQ